MLPFYMLRRIPGIEFTLMERIYNNLSLVKMPHSNFKSRATKFNTGVGKCSCSQTLDFTSEREMNMKLGMHHKFCSNPPKASDKVEVPKKATTMREQQLNE